MTIRHTQRHNYSVASPQRERVSAIEAPIVQHDIQEGDASLYAMYGHVLRLMEQQAAAKAAADGRLAHLVARESMSSVVQNEYFNPDADHGVAA